MNLWKDSSAAARAGPRPRHDRKYSDYTFIEQPPLTASAIRIRPPCIDSVSYDRWSIVGGAMSMAGAVSRRGYFFSPAVQLRAQSAPACRLIDHGVYKESLAVSGDV